MQSRPDASISKSNFNQFALIVLIVSALLLGLVNLLVEIAKNYDEIGELRIIITSLLNFLKATFFACT